MVPILSPGTAPSARRVPLPDVGRDHLPGIPVIPGTLSLTLLPGIQASVQEHPCLPLHPCLVLQPPAATRSVCPSRVPAQVGRGGVSHLC